MAESGLDSLRQTHEVEITFRAFELRPTGSPPIPAEYRARIEQGWPRVQLMAQERFNVEMKRPVISAPGATFLAHVGAKFAIEQGKGDAYHHAIFTAVWQQERSVGSPDDLAKIAGEIGFDETAFLAALENEEYHRQVIADERWAYQQGLGGVPAMIFGDRYLVSGAQPVDVLREVADRCISEGLANNQ